MVAIDADNRDIRRAIEKLVTLTEASGARFSDEIIVRYKQGNFSIASKSNEKGKPFMRLPLSSLPRFDQFQFSLDGNDLGLSGWSEAVPQQHFQIVDAMIELYNLCGKAKRHRLASAWLFLADQPELLPLILEGRDDPTVNGLVGRIRAGYIGDLVLDTFLMTRYIMIDNLLLLMPVAEFVNHSNRAQTFYFPPRAEGGGVTVRRTRIPKRFGDECFASYGKLDSLDSWLIYNFVEEYADFVRSVPLDIELPGVGTIRVHGYIMPGGPSKIPPELEDLRDWMPEALVKERGLIEIRFLLIPSVHSPNLRRVLRWVIDQLAPGHAQADSLVASAEAQVLEKNWAYYEALRQRLKTIVLKNPAKKPVLDVLNNLCALQHGRLVEYGK